MVLKLKIFVFPPPRAPVTPPPPRDRPRESQIDYRKSSPAALRSCGAERVFAPPAAKKEKRLKNSPFCPKKKTEGDVLFTCPEPNAGRRGGTGAHGGGKTKNPLFGARLYHSILKEIVRYHTRIVLCMLSVCCMIRYRSS